jgi:hypothetical protein
MTELKKINEYKWEVPQTGNMRVPGIIYADETMLRAIEKEGAVTQVSNVATLPGIIKASFAMPDVHQGYGFSIGGVAAFDWEEGIISPGGVGYDINCLMSDSRILNRHSFFGRSCSEILSETLQIKAGMVSRFALCRSGCAFIIRDIDRLMLTSLKILYMEITYYRTKIHNQLILFK